ncbi:hypothetical protein [Synechocystis sp. LKSZ1]|uniref:hypothetical protein n=1 Tax=Synechocystis sp. LKSZ1 TaxID=3144951 RepID=UPI00336C2A55
MNQQYVLQQQIQDLSHKIDQLQQMVMHLSRQFSEVLAPGHLEGPRQDTASGASLGEVDETVLSLQHKDILPDEPESPPFWFLDIAQPATSELQIYRLTAQLTAAYHRIAALEERLMAQRSHF